MDTDLERPRRELLIQAFTKRSRKLGKFADLQKESSIERADELPSPVRWEAKATGL
jgi:hypothetical protein